MRLIQRLKARRGFALILATAACAGRKDAPAQNAGIIATTATRTIPADPDPCRWIDSAAVARLLGPMSAAPYRAHDASNAEPTADGRACAYTLRRVESGADGAEVAVVEVMMKDGVADQTAADGALALAARVLHAPSEPTAAETRPPSDTGWDATSGIPNEFVGRVGHMAVHIQLHTHGAPFSSVPIDSVRRLAALVRDAVPDLPPAAPREEWNTGDEGDPCSLITRAEAEGVLGPLAVTPYRSNGDTPLVDPTGDGCSYFVGRHRVLTIKPEWSNGRTLFRIQAAASRAFAAPVGLKLGSADTLEGAWDEAAAGVDGTLYLLKGDRMLSVVYRTAGLSQTSALHLAGLAIARLR
jgi:hypothetical protein